MVGKYTSYTHYEDTGEETMPIVPSDWTIKQVRYLIMDGHEGMKIGPFGSALKLEDKQIQNHYE